MGAPNVILLVTDHAADALDDLRREQREHLERAAALGRQIATIEAMRIIGQEHAEAEGNGDGKSDGPHPRDG